LRTAVNGNHQTPNPSLNTDVPYAGLRPRNGPPVS